LERDSLEIPDGITPEIDTLTFASGSWQTKVLNLPREMSFTIYINTHELVTILCTPAKLNCLTLGYLSAEGIIGSMQDVVSMRVCEDDSLADVMLKDKEIKLPEKRILTSGCGGGISLAGGKVGPKVESDLTVAPEQLLGLMRSMLRRAELYNLSGGIHTSALADPEAILVIGEDIGRHNTLDKIVGESMLLKIPTRDKILVSSGRVSSEMLRKASRMGTPIIASLTAPTESAVMMARELEICLVGYVRGNSMTVYSKPERLGATVPAQGM